MLRDPVIYYPAAVPNGSWQRMATGAYLGDFCLVLTSEIGGAWA